MRSNMLTSGLKATAFAAALLTAGAASAADVFLQAQAFTKPIPDNDPVPMWGFASCTDGTFTSCDAPSSPGPQIDVDLTAGSPLTIHVNNTLPVPVSVIVPGLSVDGDPEMMIDARGRTRVRSMTHEALPGNSSTYTMNLRAGTFLYHSGTAPSLEVPMGLYGALVVRDGANAYPADTMHAAVTPDSEALLLFSELDPIQNRRLQAAAAAAELTQDCVSLAQYVAGGETSTGYPCTVDYTPVITLVNGSLTTELSGFAPGDTALLRLLNAGQRTHVPAMPNVEMELIAEDGFRYPGNTRVQNEALLTAGKTIDALIATSLAAGDITYAVSDHMPSYVNQAAPTGGPVAGIVIGMGTPPPPTPTIYTMDDTYSVPEDAVNYAGTSVLANDVGLTGASVGPAGIISTANGKVNLSSSGTFTYTPDADFSGTDTFTYIATLGGQSYPANVMLNVSFDNDAPTAVADGPYTNQVGTTVTVDAAHGVLGNDIDPDGDALTAVLDGAVAGLTLNPDGSFEYTGGSSTNFSYHADDNTGSMNSTSNSITVDIQYGTPSGIALNVNDGEGTAVESYRWIVQEDATYHDDPASPPSTWLSTNFHTSYMKVVAQGCVGVECATDNPVIPVAAFTQAVLDPAKHYYVSVLPNDAGTGDSGHSIGGAPIPAGTVAPATIDVIVNAQPIPAAQISVIIFNDNAPTNGVPDAGESGLEGFNILIEDAAGRYGMSPGTVNFDVNGEPLKNAAACAPPAPVGVILTCADGTALIQNMPPGKYGIFAVPPAGSGTWTQTSTIEGTKVQDVWVQANEPPFLTEFGAPGYHAFIGFVNPDQITPLPIPDGEIGHSISGNVTMFHTARAPDNTAFDSGNYNALGHTRPWIGLNSSNGVGPNVATVHADLVESGGDLLAQFTIPNIPDGTYQLVAWDDYLDQIISYQTVIVAGGDVNVGNMPVPTWFGRSEHTVFLDANGNGIRDGGEDVGLTETNVNLRFRDGTINQAFPTDSTGFVPFDQQFPFGAWQVMEIDFARYKATGVTITVDGGGDVSGGPYPGLLNPQAGSPREEISLDDEGNYAPVLLEGFQTMPGMTSLYDWAKAQYAPGENGGISGIVFNGTTRGENDPRLTVGDTWEPGIPGVTVRLHKEIDAMDKDNAPLGNFPGEEDVDYNGNGILDVGKALKLVDAVQTDSWDGSLPTGCPGEPLTINGQPNTFVTETLGGDATRCFDGIRNWEQVRPGALFDGGYAFGDLKPGAYVVEVVPPQGYEVIKEENKNVDFGDTFAMAPVPMVLAAAMVVLPDAAMVAEAKNPQWGIAAPPCVGPDHRVPDTLSLFPGEVNTYAPYAGADRPLCNMKRVVLSDQANAAADFHLFTATPVAGQLAGLSSDDVAIETNLASPNFSDKWGPAWMPFSLRDFKGQLVYRGYTDGFGHYNALVPSTFSAHIPIPSGYSPGMYSICLNERMLPDGVTPDPKHLSAYGTFCYQLMYMPGTTTYGDTPILPLAAFAAGYNPVDCALPTTSPMVVQVDGAATGPLVAPGGTLTITSAGKRAVPNPDYEGPLAPAPQNEPTIMRDYGFGTDAGTVSLGDTVLTGVGWGDATITAPVPAGFAPGDYELVVVSADGIRSINTVTVTVGTETATHVTTAGGPNAIQNAIDLADPGDLIIVEPGTYREVLVMWKPVRLQGSGASTVIDGLKLPTTKVGDWQAKVAGLVANGDVDLLDGQPADQFNLVGTGLLANEQAGTITVLSKNDGSWDANPSRIDGFTITGGDGGGGIYVNGWADNLVISNNSVTGNAGNLHGGIRIGQPNLPLVGNGPFGFNQNVKVHHNAIVFNGAQADMSIGGGLAIATGTDGYQVTDNYFCGNFSLGDGAGIGHRGLSSNGVIARNRVLFNQNFNQGIGANGGGLLIAGEPPVATTLTLGSGNVTVDANLFLGNQAGAGYGGAVRTESVNGMDVSTSPWEIVMTNNTMVNNVAGGGGGGISLQDTVNAVIQLNTIANNDSTATLGALAGSGPLPAGIMSENNSPGLAAVMPGVDPDNATFSNPTMRYNVLWHNRAFTYNGSALQPVLGIPTQAGECTSGANYLDLGVIGVAGANLNPLESVLTSTAGYNPNRNIAADPLFANEYCNTSRILSTAGLMHAATEVTEGGNATDVRFGPLTLAWPPGSDPWDYHIGGISPAIDIAQVALGNPNTPALGGMTIGHDRDGQGRPKDLGYDAGSDEYYAAANLGSAAFTAASGGYAFNGTSLNFGNLPNNPDVTSTITVTVTTAPVTISGVALTGSNNYTLGNNTCTHAELTTAGDTCTIDVIFDPQGGNVKNAVLAIAYGADDSPKTLNITGR